MSCSQLWITGTDIGGNAADAEDDMIDAEALGAWVPTDAVA